MKRLYVLLTVVIAACSISGCGNKELGPANPDETPKVTQEDINKSIKNSMDSMPDAQRKQYEKSMQSGSK